MTLQVAYIGNFSQPYCTEVHISKTLQSMGVVVHELQEDTFNVRQWGQVIRAKEVDVVLFTRTWINASHDKAAELTQLFKELSDEGKTVASYHLDLYMGITREDSLNGDPFWSTDYVFTPDGDPASQEKFGNLGISHYYIRPGVFKGECYIGEYNPKMSHKVAFVGTVQGYHREWPYRQVVHNWLKDTYGDDYGKYGHPEQIVRNEQLNNLYASTNAIVGDTLCPGFNKPSYWSDRVYETVGRGGCLIHPYIEGMESEFTDGKHLLYYEYGDFGSLKQKIEMLNDDPDLRAYLRVNGVTKVYQDCTYNNRLKQAFKIMGFDIE